MREEVYMAGLGGQGILLAGQVLAQTGVDVGYEASWVPSYSPEVRGGEANCTVVLSDGRVGSPICGHPRVMLLMDPRSVRKYLRECASGGIAIINPDLGEVEADRKDLQILFVPVTSIAKELGNEMCANMVMLGAYLQAVRPDLIEPAIKALSTVLPERRQKTIPMNTEAIRRGAQVVAELS
ncbi:2-oxoacid:acceptor oxidoreductase family protein [bacterium]|nr:2-oxoacid:acceptor oxidoreductase family protein [bacterium]